VLLELRHVFGDRVTRRLLRHEDVPERIASRGAVEDTGVQGR